MSGSQRRSRAVRLLRPMTYRFPYIHIFVVEPRRGRYSFGQRGTWKGPGLYLGTTLYSSPFIGHDRNVAASSRLGWQTGQDLLLALEADTAAYSDILEERVSYHGRLQVLPSGQGRMNFRDLRGRGCFARRPVWQCKPSWTTDSVAKNVRWTR